MLCAREEEKEAYCFLIEYFTPQEIVKETRNGSSELSVYRSDREELLGLRTQAKNHAKKVLLCKIKKSEWAEPWKKHKKSFRLTETYRVMPAWRKKTRRKSRQDIIIDTELTFGLGDHPTTGMMARIVERNISGGERFLDIGAGTGILSIVAGKCGAGRVTAVDSSQEAVLIAEKNFASNGIKRAKSLKAFLESFDKEDAFDMVVANLNTSTLLANCKKIVSFVEEDGFLAISGFLQENLKKVKSAFTDEHIRELGTYEKSGWMAALFRKESK